MATIWAGQLPYSRPNIGGEMGRAFWEGAGKKEAEEEKVFAAVVQMYREAAPEDQELLSKSPGWSNVVAMATKKGIPMIPNGKGGLGFAAKSKTLEEQVAEEAQSSSLTPSGFVGRLEGLKAEATGVKQENFAKTGYYQTHSRLLSDEMEHKKNELEWQKKVKAGEMSLEEMKVQIAKQNADSQERDSRSLGAFRAGSLQVERDKLAQDSLLFQEKKKALMGGLTDESLRANKAAQDKFDTFNKGLSAYKTALREPLRMADRVTAINQMVGQYMGYYELVNSTNPIEMAGLHAATIDVMTTLADEVTRSGGTDSKLEKERITNYLNTIEAAGANGLLPPEIFAQLKQTLKVAGYNQKVDKTTGKATWIFPDEEGGGFWGLFGRGGTP